MSPTECKATCHGLSSSVLGSFVTHLSSISFLVHFIHRLISRVSVWKWALELCAGCISQTHTHTLTHTPFPSPSAASNIKIRLAHVAQSLPTSTNASVSPSSRLRVSFSSDSCILILFFASYSSGASIRHCPRFFYRTASLLLHTNPCLQAPSVFHDRSPTHRRKKSCLNGP